MIKYFISLLFLVSLHDLYADDLPINTGQEWFLDSRSNRLSPTNSKVLYFMPSDAYQTYRARQFGDWDVFSVVDGRNLERLNKGDIIMILACTLYAVYAVGLRKKPKIKAFRISFLNPMSFSK